MNTQALIDIFKEAYLEKIITNLEYHLLDTNNDTDLNTINLLTTFDEEGFCFGDYDVLAGCEKYLNFAIYLEHNLIGYLGYCYHYENEDIFSLCLCLKPNYQGKGIGKVILAQVINTIFNEYDIAKVVAEIVEDNHKSWHLFTSFGFKEKEKHTFLFPTRGFLLPQHELEYSRSDYNKEKKYLRRYRNLKIK